jgi:ribosomal protein L16/L10AE
LYELTGVTETEARDAFRLAAAKLPISTKVLARVAE